MARAFLVVMDSVGIGGAPDAAEFFNGESPDTGANTVGHIAEACAAGRAEEGRTGPLYVPTMDALGIGAAVRLASGQDALGLGAKPKGRWGAATEISRGKDTPSGHWELAGLPVPWDWHYFPDARPAFPADLSRLVAQLAGTDGILGDRHASGTEIVTALGAEHLRTGWPICYTSADSVFQIAAHEANFGLDRLLDLCRDLAPHLHEMKVGRVIARPFVGSETDGFTRTPNRRDYAITPPAPLLTNWIQEAGRRVYAIGKIGDVLSMQGIDEVRKGPDAVLMKHLSDLVDIAEDGSLTFANFVEFDSLYGHCRDISGYAHALEWFDAEIGRILPKLKPDDMLILTADHGNDPSWTGTDHTRERVPVLIAGRGVGPMGDMMFADVAATVAAHLGVASQGPGRNRLRSGLARPARPALKRPKREGPCPMSDHLTIVDHPLVLHKLSLMRDKSTPTSDFRRLLKEITLLLAYEVTRELPVTSQSIDTPLEEMDAPILAGKKVALVSILRAGNGMLDGVLELIPSARVGFVGLYRDEDTLQPVQYYFKVPEPLADRPVIVVDPMLATGNSSAAAMDLLKKTGATDIKFLCLLAAPEGVTRMKEAHPDVHIVTAALDRELSDKGYIMPGLGDAGDRMFGTK